MGMDNLGRAMLRDMFLHAKVEGKVNEWTFARLHKEISFNGWIEKGQYHLCWTFYAPFIRMLKKDIVPDLKDVLVKKGDRACKIRGARGIAFHEIKETGDEQGTLTLNLQDLTKGLKKKDRVIIAKITTAEQMNKLYKVLKKFATDIGPE